MRRWAKAAAVVAGASTAAHLALTVGPGVSGGHRLVLLTMAAMCGACMPALWRSATVRTWISVLAMYALMALAHPLLGHGADYHAAMQLHPASASDHGRTDVWGPLYAAVHVAPYLQFVIGGVVLVRLRGRSRTAVPSGAVAAGQQPPRARAPRPMNPSEG